MQIMERPRNNYTKIKLLLDGQVFMEINLPSNTTEAVLLDSGEHKALPPVAGETEAVGGSEVMTPDTESPAAGGFDVVTPDAGAHRVPVRHILAPTAGGSEVMTPFVGSPDAGETQAGATEAQATQILFENTADEETYEEMEEGFTKIRPKSKCQTELISKQERNRVALTLVLWKRSN